MTNQRAGDNDAAPVTSNAQAEDHDAAAAMCGEKSDPAMEQSVSPSKQSGRFKRLCRRINHEPPWWVSQIFVAVLVGLLVGGVTLFSGKYFSDIQARQSRQLENLRFVRDRAAKIPNQRSPFAHLDLEGQDLSGLQLSRASFNYANLNGADLGGSDLTDADLMGAKLRGASLSGANLAGANLCFADLTGANIESAKLPDAILGSANLTRANFQRAFLARAKFSHASFQVDEHTGEICPVVDEFGDDAPPNLTKTDLCSSDLAGADLKEASNLTSANLDHIHYDENTKWPDGFRPPKPSESLTPDGLPPPGRCPHPPASPSATRQSGPLGH
jgi:uncharacterized protein YjbI with pentapeptide repeats